MGYAKTYQVIGVSEDFWHQDFEIFAKRIGKLLKCNLDVVFWDYVLEEESDLPNEFLDYGNSETQKLFVERFEVAQEEDFKKDTANHYSIEFPILDPSLKNFDLFPETGIPEIKKQPYFDIGQIEFLPSGMIRFGQLHCGAIWEHHLERLMYWEPTSLEVNHRDSYRDFFCALGITKVIMLPDEDYCAIEVHTKWANNQKLTINELMDSFEVNDGKCFVSYNVHEMKLNEDLPEVQPNDLFLIGEIDFYKESKD